MEKQFASPQEALDTLADAQDPDRDRAFAFLSRHPDTAAPMIETFRETLEQLGVQPSGADAATGHLTISVADVARTLGVPAAQLEWAVDRAPEARGD